ncbi:MAG: bifunctional diaminohydroxyphosphoribosylaminopyrimidine deaminase/5-amino-6-(5-phosphoribosylamino)uracil reductase RibD [Acidobacteriota bacterium]|nr:bifunctional diaminohydroxyphosphoribosylaminopyrimidine deaminase/5-amino-6-(5-phosphoribosylamino)uracil reductase RibD [Acidobacteriota bacterium]
MGSDTSEERQADAGLMDVALELAARGKGATAPNPMVGALLHRDDRIVGRGYHERAGGRHAEVVALDEAGAAARGATLYCTLEPCCHTGRTGPCVERIVKAGVLRVVVAHEDPNPLVNGAGVGFLRAHGVKVEVGVRRAEATRLNEAFLVVHPLARPFVTLKAAVSLDASIAAAPGQQTPLTGRDAQTHAHTTRAEVDAIGVGSGTVLVDNPQLTARGVARRRPFVRVLFDTRLRTPPQAKVLTTLTHGPVVIMTTETAVATWPQRALALTRAGATLERLPERNLEGALTRLLEYDVSDLVIEGGAELHRAVWQAGVVDRVRLYISPVRLGPRGVRWMRDTRFSFAALGQSRTRWLGEDVLLEADVQRFD